MLPAMVDTHRRGFRGIRNTDTTAATAASVAVRKAKATKRRITAAVDLLTEHGYTVKPPRASR